MRKPSTRAEQMAKAVSALILTVTVLAAVVAILLM